MRLKLDENLPAALAEMMRLHGHDADTVPEEALAGKEDTAVWNASQAAGRFLITQDLDFADIRAFAPGPIRAFCSSVWQIRRVAD